MLISANEPRSVAATARDRRRMPGDAAGADREIHFTTSLCELGVLLVARSERGICAVLLGDDPADLERDLRQRLPEARLRRRDPEMRLVAASVAAFVEAPRRDLALPLDLRGTAFQRKVWQALRDIPAGKTSTYTEIAARIGLPRAVRAVAGACAANLLAVVVPCHRVLRKDGGLSGYRWGVARKRRLLDLEAR